MKKKPIQVSKRKNKSLKISEPEIFVSEYKTNYKPKCKMCEVWKWLYTNQGTFESSEQWRNSLVEFLEKTFL